MNEDVLKFTKMHWDALRCSMLGVGQKICRPNMIVWSPVLQSSSDYLVMQILCIDRIMDQDTPRSNKWHKINWSTWPAWQSWPQHWQCPWVKLRKWAGALFWRSNQEKNMFWQSDRNHRRRKNLTWFSFLGLDTPWDPNQTLSIRFNINQSVFLIS